jgi:heat shock protein HslJ
MLVCARCGSQSLVSDQEYVVGVGWVSYPKCFKCGSVKVEERWNEVKQEPQQAQVAVSSPMTVLKKEERMAECRIGGCGKWASVQGMCNAHFYEAYEITAGQYNQHKTSRGEDPRNVVKRIAELRAERDKKAKEGFESACEEERERRQPHNKATAEFAYPVTPPEPIPLIQLFLYPELLDALTAAAKKEWRTPEGQAAYLIEKGLEVKA